MLPERWLGELSEACVVERGRTPGEQSRGKWRWVVTDPNVHGTEAFLAICILLLHEHADDRRRFGQRVSDLLIVALDPAVVCFKSPVARRRLFWPC